MKEIWKLIELLNEYDSWWDYDDYYWPYQYWQDRDAYIYGKYYLVSRDYWFIKWLVENDKIDYEKVRSWEWNGSRWHFETVQPEYYIIMLLAIQDEPIRFLCEILK
jgi:hypothetical protein